MQQELTAKACGMSELSTCRTILLQLWCYWHGTKIPKTETNPDNSGGKKSMIFFRESCTKHTEMFTRGLCKGNWK